MKWVFDDGGRAQAGFKGRNGDCVTRAISIVLEMPYAVVVNMVDVAATAETPHNVTLRSSSQTGVYSDTTKKLLKSLGWEYVSLERGKVKTYLQDGALPSGRLIVQFHGHLTAVIDGVQHDTHDFSRTRVMGYYHRANSTCAGCGVTFKGSRGLKIHQGRRFQTLACKPRSTR